MLFRVLAKNKLYWITSNFASYNSLHSGLNFEAKLGVSYSLLTIFNWAYFSHRPWKTKYVALNIFLGSKMSTKLICTRCLYILCCTHSNSSNTDYVHRSQCGAYYGSHINNPSSSLNEKYFLIVSTKNYLNTILINARSNILIFHWDFGIMEKYMIWSLTYKYRIKLSFGWGTWKNVLR